MYKKISRTAAKKTFEDGLDVSLTTSKINPNKHSKWVHPWTINKEILNDTDATFEQICNEYQYYNCCDELGNEINFWIKED